MQLPTRKLTVFILPCIFVFVTGCNNYYKARAGRTGDNASATLDSLSHQNRFFILRTGDEAFHMKRIVLSSDRKTLTCNLDTLPAEHRLHLKLGHKGNLQYKKSELEQVKVLNEVHLYTGFSNVVPGENFGLSLDKVQKIEVIERDAKRTTNSYVIGAIGYTAGALLLAGIIIAATKSSCPFVSAYDGKEFALQGEIYGGAIYPQLARHDYLPLKMAPSVDGLLQLKISNELKEKQYTDFANLLVITHDAGTKILCAENGDLYSITSPQIPVTATLNGKKNILPALLKEADDAVAYMDDTSTANAANTITVRFKKQGQANKAKLILTLKNAYWLDLLYGELAKGFGSYYGTYMKQQANKPAAELIKWTKDQQMPLSVSILTKKGHRQVADLTTVGPLANRTIVVPVDLTDVDKNEIEINLSSGFMFWEIDYAGLDFSAGTAFTVEKLSPLTATDETGKNVLPTLEKEDGVYLEQPEIGNTATITYQPTRITDASKTQTFILNTKGWYQHIRDYKNSPNLAFLQRFTKPNAFPVYGKELYRQMEQESFRLMAVK